VNFSAVRHSAGLNPAAALRLPVWPAFPPPTKNTSSVSYPIKARQVLRYSREYLAGLMAFVGMRRLLLFVLLFGCGPVFADQHEIGLTLGGLFPQNRGTIPNTVRLGGGTALRANYGHRLVSGRLALYGEVHFLANPQRLVGSGNPASAGHRHDLCHAWDPSKVCCDAILFPLRCCWRRLRHL